MGKCDEENVEKLVNIVGRRNDAALQSVTS
jgi:hypothetical protein